MIKVLGIDAALSNMGIAEAIIDAKGIEVTDLHLHSTERQDKKLVRKSSDDLRRAQELVIALCDSCKDSKALLVFAEVPSGSQSAVAARALGIAVGVLASCPLRIIEVSQLEVKLASVGKRTATKPEMIKWAVSQWPDANWHRHERNGKGFKKGDLKNENEHLADACAVIKAGIQTNEFQLLLRTLGHEIASTPNSRHTFHGSPKRRLSLERVELVERPVTGRRR